ncbi:MULTISPECIES: class I SAM-dependent methyltransferase [unclassified Solwaraspora]|uniref:class I SAM-dependent methyltransferase n=1 Tax=unclassified Solwaraspora TaxID=2627926 RepID=UPI00248B021C|nr:MULTISPECIES: class I SAM-dependent methyltransferase [unclassified Solwaraspora]WBB98733.1 class I SAM-dependent methyltransferase [Solwaraspora sp. WMMA2059]WBC22714.1 class I SAM-dependent methyltransferase [Solwaraspora sp. WMMA2080]WJK35236.1 class I SAM-dependent methyltransferase [Solwaraspora sp. WMMA2065]
MTAFTPVLPERTASYLRTGLHQVKGWLNVSTAVYLSGVRAAQREAGVSGDVAEIGIHHGKSFLCLALDLPADQRAVAIDVFDDQAANLDQSGRGDREIFEQNLTTYGAGDNVDIVQSSSLDLEQAGFVAAGRRFRIFSIDGGHTDQITVNDLRIAERTVVDDGLVVLDDVLNRHWLGVITGLFSYLGDGGSLVPAVLVPNKLILATSADQAKHCRAMFAEQFPNGLEKGDVPLAGHQIDVYGDRPWLVRGEDGRSEPVTGHELMATISAARLAELEQQLRSARAELDTTHRQLATTRQQLRAAAQPLYQRAARRLPWLARPVRPVFRRVRAVVRRSRGSSDRDGSLGG